MKFEIKHKITGSILFEIETSSWRLAVEAAVKSSANLRYANLRYADLSYANLRYADLSYANLRYANLRYADLSYANLSYANLRYADLRYADLSSANLRYANLRSAENAELTIAMTRILPGGDIIGWKKCKNDVIVKLKIPANAKRSNAFGRKCRAEYAEVLEVIGANKGVSSHDGKTTYIVGETVRADIFDDDFTNECSGGIHFFITREEAERY